MDLLKNHYIRICTGNTYVACNVDTIPQPKEESLRINFEYHCFKKVETQQENSDQGHN